MCLEDQISFMEPTAVRRAHFNPANCSIGSTIRTVLREAQNEKRLTVGLLPAIQRLSTHGSDGALFCLMAPARPGDSARHMQEVLLEAFCLENDIYMVKVDSAEKLYNLLPSYSLRDCCCILVHPSYPDSYKEQSSQFSLDDLSPPDKTLAEHCEIMFGIQPTPIIRLPEQ